VQTYVTYLDRYNIASLQNLLIAFTCIIWLQLHTPYTMVLKFRTSCTCIIAYE